MSLRLRLWKLAGRSVERRYPPREAWLRSDLHTHLIRQCALEAARSRGLETIAVVATGESPDRFLAFRSVVERMRCPGLEVLVGLEARARNLQGDVDACPAAASAADLVLGAVTGFPDGLGGYLDPASLSPAEAAFIEFQALWSLLDNPEVDVLAHPGALTCVFFGSFPATYLDLLARKAARAGCAVELCPHGHGKTAVAAACRSADAYVARGSGAFAAPGGSAQAFSPGQTCLEAWNSPTVEERRSGPNLVNTPPIPSLETSKGRNMNMLAAVRNVIAQEEGQSMAEYGLILALVAVVCIAGFTLLGGNINTMVSDLASKISP